jgi:hypothetical protein
LGAGFNRSTLAYNRCFCAYGNENERNKRKPQELDHRALKSIPNGEVEQMRNWENVRDKHTWFFAAMGEPEQKTVKSIRLDV